MISMRKCRDLIFKGSRAVPNLKLLNASCGPTMLVGDLVWLLVVGCWLHAWISLVGNTAEKRGADILSVSNNSNWNCYISGALGGGLATE